MKTKEIKKMVAKKTGLPIDSFEIREVNEVAFGGSLEVWYLVKGQTELTSIKI